MLSPDSTNTLVRDYQSDMECPSVSVIVPVYNAAPIVGRAIDSVLTQTYRGSIEIIIADDGSSDDTMARVRGYGGRITALNLTHAGVAAARNAAVRASCGELIAFLDADDMWLPEKLQRTVAALLDNSGCVLAYHDGIETDTEGNVIRRSIYPEDKASAPTLEDLISYSSPALPILFDSVVVRREIFERIGGFDERLGSSEDTWFLIMARELGSFSFLPDALMVREKGASALREQWYVDGAWTLRRMIRDRYGRTVRSDHLQHVLIWAAHEAWRRGDQGLARQRYWAAGLERPLRAKTWVGLLATVAPFWMINAIAKLIVPESHWLRADSAKHPELASGVDRRGSSTKKIGRPLDLNRDPNTDKPTVSAIIPVKNGERTIGRAINSALAQTFAAGIEVIVIDNGSTDSTPDILGSYGGGIIVVHEVKPGAPAARNAGIAIARGKYLAFLDADDEWLPEKLAKVIPLLENDSAYVLAYHDAIEVNNQGTIIKNSYYPLGHKSAPTLRNLLAISWPGLPILPSNVVMRRDVANRIGGFNEKVKGMEDAAMWIFAREQGPFSFLPEALTRREWEPTQYREELYISASEALSGVLRPRFGRRAAAAALIPTLNWAGTMAMLRGDRSLARKRYLASLRIRPTRLKTWIRVFGTLLPADFLARGERLRYQRLYGESDRTIDAALAARSSSK